MLSSVRGTVVSINLDHVVIEVGGIGFTVRTTPATSATLRRGEQAKLSTTLVVREDSLTLFGFVDDEARELFGLLQTVSGVGPKLALATLSVLEPDKLCAALSEGNIAVLTQVPGIGRKAAERLIIELRDKVNTLTPAARDITPSKGNEHIRDQVIEALLGLGFPIKQAEQTVEIVLAENDSADTATVLRRALADLGRKKR